MVMAFIRPEVADLVIRNLGADGFTALSRMDVYGRGKQNGVNVRGSSYDMPKTMLITVVDDDSTREVVEAIGNSARTGNIGDGKIFVTPVIDAYTVRTGEVGL